MQVDGQEMCLSGPQNSDAIASWTMFLLEEAASGHRGQRMWAVVGAAILSLAA